MIDARERVWLAYRRGVSRSLDELLPPGAAYWPDCDYTLWPIEGEEHRTLWVAPPELRRMKNPQADYGSPDTFPCFLYARLRTKAAVQRYLTNNGNTPEARDACKQMMAFACAREPREETKRHLTFMILWFHAPECLNFAPTKRTP